MRTAQEEKGTECLRMVMLGGMMLLLLMVMTMTDEMRFIGNMRKDRLVKIKEAKAARQTTRKRHDRTDFL